MVCPVDVIKNPHNPGEASLAPTMARCYYKWRNPWAGLKPAPTAVTRRLL
ncbi:MAG: hypothetical protein LBM98_06555 [Oscillospiraceae bacterium]|nr:hypothetical protein [Oscillospiraceae bacterium]